MRGRRVARFVLACLGTSSAARAGGFEIPDNGTQALGRGAAFVAKANDPTAIYWNPAGLARQRGTNLLVDANVYLHSFDFQRAGNYPDDPTKNPWGGAPYPLVSNQSGPYLSPFAALTTDFGYFDRFTLGLGVYSLPIVGNRTFPLGIDNKPSPSRYDFVQSRTTYLLPTAAMAFRLTPWLDLGVSGHLVLGNIDQTSQSYIDLPPPACADNQGQHEDFQCDARNSVNGTGTGIAATIGAMLRPAASFAFGASFRSPTNINARGTYSPENPIALQGEQLASGAATYALQLPWMVRVGGRYIGMDADFEVYDLELDVSYEGWGSAQGLGAVVTIPDAGSFKDIQTVVLHGYTNTFGIRGGGAYNFDTGQGVLSIRGGAYFDASATDFKYTRLDFDTLAKVAGTLGVGYRIGPFGVDIGYAAVASIPRTVGTGSGDIRPINEKQGGDVLAADGSLLPSVNEGSYRGFTHIFSFGVSASIDALFGAPRPIHYGNPYEPNYVEAAP